MPKTWAPTPGGTDEHDETRGDFRIQRKHNGSQFYFHLTRKGVHCATAATRDAIGIKAEDAAQVNWDAPPMPWLRLKVDDES